MTSGFRRCYRGLSPLEQRLAKVAYRMFSRDPAHPGLNFKCVDAVQSIYSARISLSCRVVGTLDGDTVTWFFIGDHDAYQRLLRRL